MRDNLLKLLYIAAIFVSAFLLFVVQPLIARMMLPRYGGSPAVWNTSLVFFQLALLAGYAYAHASLERLPWRAQGWIHVAVLLVALAALPPALHARWQAPPTAWPVPWVLAGLAAAVGLPFFALATNSTLVQRWFSLSGLGGSHDPYWLYAASNVGSLLALMAYPFVIEPAWGIRAQTLAWSKGYVLFVGLTLAGLVVSRRRAGAGNIRHDPVGPSIPPPVSDDPAGSSIPPPVSEDSASPSTSVSVPNNPAASPSPAVTWRRRGGWILRTATASSLLLAVTMHFTTDVAAIPLFWVAPLAVYLLTFIIAFATPLRHARPVVAGMTVLGIMTMLMLLLIPASLPLAFKAGMALLTLFAGALLCHSDVAADRPGAAQLSDFYLALSIGGALGGVLNSLVAPVVFKSVAEFPITLAVLAWLVLRPSGAPGAAVKLSARLWRIQSVAVLGIVLAMIGAVAARAAGLLANSWLVVPFVVLLGGVLLAWLPRPFPVAVTLVALFLAADLNSGSADLAERRGFFGVLRVRENSTARMLIHGTTNHGGQLKDPALARTPIAYYHPKGPLGAMVAAQPPGAHIALVGLGTGSLAALGKAGQTITYFEIDPLVEDLATHYFTYLAGSPAKTNVVIGDARLTLADTPDGQFDLILIDAFSSDAIPVHLLTSEAVDLYLSKLKPDGIVVFHLSNRYVRFDPLFRALAQDKGLSVASAEYKPAEAEQKLNVFGVTAMAVTRSAAVLDRLLAGGGMWRRLDAGRAVLWTDDYSNLVGLLNWTGERGGGG